LLASLPRAFCIEPEAADAKGGANFIPALPTPRNINCNAPCSDFRDVGKRADFVQGGLTRWSGICMPARRTGMHSRVSEDAP
jgi:hypothetical protein